MTDNVVPLYGQRRSDATAYEDAVRRQRRDEPFPFVDYPEPTRYVRPVSPVAMAEATRDDNLDLYRTLEEQERIARVVADIRRDDRVLFWQRTIKCAAILLIYALLAYFSFQIGRGL